MKPAAAGRGIRDKIAAFKRKGIRTGGPVPLGYDAEDRRPIVNPAEAGIVRQLFALYLDSVWCGALRKRPSDWVSRPSAVSAFLIRRWP